MRNFPESHSVNLFTWETEYVLCTVFSYTLHDMTSIERADKLRNKGIIMQTFYKNPEIGRLLILIDFY